MIPTTTGLRRFASLAPAFLGALACCGLALAAPAGAAGSFDGTFHQSVQTTIGRRMAIVQVDGKITGPKLEADIGTSTCAAHLSLTKS